MHSDAERAAAFVQVGHRHPAGDRGVVVGGEQHRALLPVQGGGGAGGQFGNGHRLRLGHTRLAGAFQDEVPRVGLIEAAGTVQGRAEPVQ